MDYGSEPRLFLRYYAYVLDFLEGYILFIAELDFIGLQISYLK